jgi:hypothetical protein
MALMKYMQSGNGGELASEAEKQSGQGPFEGLRPRSGTWKELRTAVSPQPSYGRLMKTS